MPDQIIRGEHEAYGIKISSGAGCMNSLLSYLVNRLWISLCRTEYKRFSESIGNVRQVQEEVLSALISNNSQTVYGMEYGFSTILTPEEFRKNVPLTSYEDYTEYIQRIKAGETAVLTAEPVVMLELSSGSASSSKFIPYTKGLKKQFTCGISPWVYDLYRSCAGLMDGKAYWSVTPVIAKKERTESGIPIGFEEDSEYFGRMEKHLLDFLFAVPGEVRQVQDSQAFHYITLLFLLKEKSLAFISVWNPTFLLLLLKPLRDYEDRLLKDLKEGTVKPPVDITPELLRVFQKKLGRNVRRAEELKEIFSSYGKRYGKSGNIESRTVYELIWPGLRLISCWTDANAEIFVPQLKKLFPNVEIQGKGLLATEAFVSFPFYKEEGALLSIRSHFFEFEELDESRVLTGNIILAHELVKNRLYSVVVTTGGGLYRYRLQDIVEVVGFTRDCPRLKFFGKGEKISDLCGEKLNDLHVKGVVENALIRNKLAVVFYLVAPEIEEDFSGYVLFIETASDDGRETREASEESKASNANKTSEANEANENEANQANEATGRFSSSNTDEDVLLDLVKDVETGLCGNFHYNYCRQLGQLGALRLFIIKGTGNCSGLETYLSTCRKLGQREGNIKPCALHNKAGWTREFEGSYFKEN
ncbi:MAG: GH3 auxin-responsive promoter family protein [Ruminiclostridium sp.]|nr:GH3 auxin-responsive promoter family protein [Ruminiclostridium sp.]